MESLTFLFKQEYKSARDFVRNLGLKSAKDWFKYAKSDKKPTDIPSTPHQVYSGKGWKGWADFLGKE